MFFSLSMPVFISSISAWYTCTYTCVYVPTNIPKCVVGIQLMWTYFFISKHFTTTFCYCHTKHNGQSLSKRNSNFLVFIIQKVKYTEPNQKDMRFSLFLSFLSFLSFYMFFQVANARSLNSQKINRNKIVYFSNLVQCN